MSFITEPARDIPVIMKADVIVVGGGPAGVGAAIRAAQTGADTIIIEKYGSFGGTNTTGFMFIVGHGKHLAGKIFDRLKSRGYIINLLEKFPDLISNPLIHYALGPSASSYSQLFAFNPDMCAHTMTDLMEENAVKMLLHSLFVDVKMGDGTIDAVVVENASGRQAIKGEVFIDATGRGDVAARSGVPYTKPGSKSGLPMPMGLMWKMAGVDREKLFEHQKKDPKLDDLIEKAKAKGELPYYRPKKTYEEMGSYEFIYTGHPRPEMCPTLHNGEMLLWMPAVHDWALNGAEEAYDLTRAEIHIRKQIISESDFLKRYVPGFEEAYLAGISPYMGIRESRHPIGEYVVTFEDIKSGCRFEDAVLRSKADIRANQKSPRGVEFDVPYRCLLPKQIDNLLLAGDDVSADHGGFLSLRTFGKAMTLGEIAGTAAALSVESTVKPKRLEHSKLKKELMKQGILTE